MGLVTSASPTFIDSDDEIVGFVNGARCPTPARTLTVMPTPEHGSCHPDMTEFMPTHWQCKAHGPPNRSPTEPGTLCPRNPSPALRRWCEPNPAGPGGLLPATWTRNFASVKPASSGPFGAPSQRRTRLLLR